MNTLSTVITAYHPNKLGKLATLSIILFPTLLFSGGVNAANLPRDTEARVNAGLGVMIANTAYNTDDDNVLLLPNLYYDNNKVYVQGIEAGGYLINNGQEQVRAFVQAGDFGFDPKEANGALKGLDEREWTALAGLSYLHRTAIGGFKVQAATDILGRSNGTVAKVAYLNRFNSGKLMVYPSVGLKWNDSTYNQYYYGVSANESSRTGVAAYEADSSISPYINLTLNYQLSNDLSGFFAQNLNYTANEQYDSPMADDRITYRSTLGMTYKF